MEKKRNSEGRGKPYVLVYLHNDFNKCKGQVPPGLEELKSQLDNMMGEGFQFFRATSQWYVAIRSTLRSPTQEEPRGYVANVALVFNREQAEELMENPASLERLKEALGTIPYERLVELHKTGLPNNWAEVILDAPKMGKCEPSPLVRDLLRVVVSDLLGERCYALVEGKDQDILTMLSLLPMKFRLASSFSSPYVGGKLWQVNNVTDVRLKLDGAPAYQRYLIGRANAGNVQVSQRAERLVNSLLMLPDGVLNQLDSLAKDEKELIKLLEFYQCMSYAVKGCDRQEVIRLNRSCPEQVAALLPLLDQDSAAKWEELSHPRRSGGGRRSLEPEEEVTSRLAGTSRIAVAGILVLALLAYLLIGTSVVPGGEGIYFTIQFTGNGLIKLLLGVLMGFCGGYLCFRRK